MGEIVEFMDDEGDMDLLRYLHMLQFLGSKNTSLVLFYYQIKESFRLLKGSPDKFK
jgi:hypothetical protein